MGDAQVFLFLFFLGVPLFGLKGNPKATCLEGSASYETLPRKKERRSSSGWAWRRACGAAGAPKMDAF